MRAWLPLALVAALAVCLYGLLLGVAAGGAVAVGGGAPPLHVPPAVDLAALLPAAPMAAEHVRAAERTQRPSPAARWLEEAGAAEAIAARLAAGHPELAPGARREVAAAIAERALAWGLDPWLVYAVIDVESGFDPDLVGAAGEVGLMQLLPSTAGLVARGEFGLVELPRRLLFDPAWNVRLGTAYLGELVRASGGDLARALAAYNAGDAVQGPTPYARSVLAVYHRLRAAGG